MTARPPWSVYGMAVWYGVGSDGAPVAARARLVVS